MSQAASAAKAAVCCSGGCYDSRTTLQASKESPSSPSYIHPASWDDEVPSEEMHAQLLRDRASRQFHRAVAEWLMSRDFERLQTLIHESGENSDAVDKQRRFIATQIPVPSGWLEVRQADNASTDTADKALATSIVAQESSCARSLFDWALDLQGRGYSEALLIRLQAFLFKLGFISHSSRKLEPPAPLICFLSNEVSLRELRVSEKGSFETAEASLIGDRSSMEDVVWQGPFHFGHLCLVADGHKDGGKIARMCCEHFRMHLHEGLKTANKVEIFHLLQAWEKTQGDVREMQDRILAKLGVATTREAFEKDLLQDQEESQRLLGGAVFAASVILHTGELLTLTQGDCPVMVLRQVDNVFQGLPVSLTRDFRSREEARRVERWIDTQTRGVKTLRRSSGALAVSLAASSLPSASLSSDELEAHEVVAAKISEESASPRDFSFNGSLEQASHDDAASACLSHDLHLVSEQVNPDRDYVGDVHVNTLREWKKWRDSLTPPHLYTLMGYSNTSRSVGDRWLQELTKGSLPIDRPKTSLVTLKPGDIVVTSSDGVDLSCSQLADLAQETSSMEAFAGSITRACLNQLSIDLPDQLMQHLPQRFLFDKKDDWISACKLWVKSKIEHSPKLLGQASDLLPAPVLFCDLEEWALAVRELIPRWLTLVRHWSSLEDQPDELGRILEFFGQLSKVQTLTAETLLSDDVYLAHWQEVTGEKVAEYEKFIGFFPIGVELTRVMDKTSRDQTLELCLEYIERWCAASRHDNLSVVALKVTPQPVEL